MDNIMKDSELLALCEEYLVYDPLSGLFYNRIDRGKVKAGSVTGHISSVGYVRLGLEGKHYSCHRLAFLMTYRHMPSGVIDHINGHKLDNRIINLRACTVGENLRNCKMRANNTSGYKGVSWARSANKWKVQLRIDGKSIYIGLFDDKIKAALAYDEYSLALYGEFAKTNHSMGLL
jgi:hypothetical protein